MYFYAIKPKTNKKPRYYPLYADGDFGVAINTLKCILNYKQNKKTVDDYIILSEQQYKEYTDQLLQEKINKQKSKIKSLRESTGLDPIALNIANNILGWSLTEVVQRSKESRERFDLYGDTSLPYYIITNDTGKFCSIDGLEKLISYYLNTLENIDNDQDDPEYGISWFTIYDSETCQPLVLDASIKINSLAPMKK